MAGPRKSERLDPAAWVRAARAALIGGGIGRVKVEVLAKALGVTTGSFYWHFADRAALLGALLSDWETTMLGPFAGAVHAAGTDARAQFDAFVDVWLAERDYDPKYDAAVRDWARHDAAADQAVHRMDEARIGLLTTIFRRAGYDEQRAFVRARVTYFHQVGYYELHLPESREAREALRPLYVEVLFGR